MALNSFSFNDLRPRAGFVGGTVSAVQLAFVVLLAVLLVRAAWLMLAPNAAVSVVTFAGPAPDLSRDVVSADLSVLTSRNAFSVSDQAGQAVIEAPETKLNFRLVGLRSVSGTGGGSATIITPDGKQSRFVVDDEIIPGVRVVEIFADRVVMSRDGALESLTLGPGRNQYAVLSSADAPAPAAPAVRPSPQDNTVRSTVSRQFLSQISLSTVGLETGESGYRMAPRGDESILTDAGFANGDIIVNVNGQEVAAIRPEEVFNEFQESEQLSLKVRRGDNTLNFELDIS